MSTEYPAVPHTAFTSFSMPSAHRELDRSLAQRVANKDESAMAELYDLYGSLVYSVLLYSLRNQSAAEDMTQEVFLRVWTSINTFDPERAGLKKWITAIARNKAVDYWRSVDGQMDRRGCEITSEAPTTRRATLEADLIFQDSVRALRHALEHLPARQSEVIRLAYFEGRTQMEIADKIRVPLGSVKTWVRTGLITLRKLLSSHPEAASLPPS